jgi:hypothetical protein
MISGAVAGRPTPLPGPYVPNCLSVLATNTGPGTLPVIFLGFWDQGGISNHLNRTVSVSLKQAEDAQSQPTKATQYRIDDKSANPLALYHRMGSPAVPSPEQRELLLSSSEVAPKTVSISSEGVVTVTMPPNSAVMLVLQ